MPTEGFLRRLSQKALQALAAKFARAQTRADAAKAYRAREPFATNAKAAAEAKRARKRAANLRAVYAGGMSGVAAA